MYFLYVDESGDPGSSGYSSPHYILSGLIISQQNWTTYLDRLKKFRKALKNTYGLNQRTEIHASELIRINKIKEYRKIYKTDRINILRDYVGQIPLIFDNAKIINVCLKKEDFDENKEVHLVAWRRLLQRYDTYLKKVADDKGIVVSDDQNSNDVMHLQRKMRIYNPTPSHYTIGTYNAPIDNILEDPFMRSSHHSYFIQTVDVVAHLLYRMEYPKGSLKKFGLEHQFKRLEPILLKEASKNDPFGIVRK
ncbi:MAG: DUF3800 domain-containing protein [Candidatus Paceibacterota bacterium]